MLIRKALVVRNVDSLSPIVTYNLRTMLVIDINSRGAVTILHLRGIYLILRHLTFVYALSNFF